MSPASVLLLDSFSLLKHPRPSLSIPTQQYETLYSSQKIFLTDSHNFWNHSLPSWLLEDRGGSVRAMHRCTVTEWPTQRSCTIISSLGDSYIRRSLHRMFLYEDRTIWFSSGRVHFAMNSFYSTGTFPENLLHSPTTVTSNKYSCTVCRSTPPAHFLTYLWKVHAPLRAISRSCNAPSGEPGASWTPYHPIRSRWESCSTKSNVFFLTTPLLSSSNTSSTLHSIVRIFFIKRSIHIVSVCVV